MPDQSIIITGNIFDGHTMFGPFEDHEAAIEWAEQQSFEHEWLVATLHSANQGDNIGMIPPKI